jgi:hypothetical protein
MWFGFNFNDSFTAKQKKNIKTAQQQKQKTAKCKMISGLSPMVEIPPGVQITVKGLERGRN